MTTVGTDQLTDTIQGLQAAANTVLNTEDARQFVDFEKYVNEVDAYVREVQQSMWADQAGITIKNLKGNDPINEDDKHVIRAFLISDAEHYLKHENNFGDWKRELTRLMDDLALRVNTADRETIADMRGVLKDAVRLVPDIRNYLEERQRVAKFEKALSSLDPASRKMLAKLMRDQLSSPKR